MPQRMQHKPCPFCDVPYRTDNLRRHILTRHRNLSTTAKVVNWLDDISISSIKKEIKEEYPQMMTFAARANQNIPINLTSRDQSTFVVQQLQKDNNKDRLILNLKEWQKSLFELIKNPIEEDRKITFICDPEGGAGKNRFIDHMLMSTTNSYLISNGSSMKLAMFNNLKDTNLISPINIFINLSRATVKSDIKSNLIEDIRDGIFNDFRGHELKYKPTLITLIIMSNFKTTDIKRNFPLTLDRYNVYAIKQDKLVYSPVAGQPRKYKTDKIVLEGAKDVITTPSAKLLQ